MSGDLSAAQLVALLREGVADGLTLAADRQQAVAVPLTPLEHGDLRGSLTVVPADVHDLEAAVVSDLPYAVRQHEDLDLRHESGGAKFLEVAAENTANEAEQLIAAAVRRRLGA